MFEVHKLNDVGFAKARELQNLFEKFRNDVMEITSGGSRETSLFTTHLEIASFYAKRAMAMKPDNHDSVDFGHD